MASTRRVLWRAGGPGRMRSSARCGASPAPAVAGAEQHTRRLLPSMQSHARAAQQRALTLTDTLPVLYPAPYPTDGRAHLLDGDALARVELQHGLQQVDRGRARVREERAELAPLRARGARSARSACAAATWAHGVCPARVHRPDRRRARRRRHSTPTRKVYTCTVCTL